MAATLRTLALALATPALALAAVTNTAETVELRVTLLDGTVQEGEVRFRDRKLEVKGRRRVRVDYRDVAALADPVPPDVEALRTEHARRAERLADDDARGWARLGRWAREEGLEAEGKADLERALKLDPADADARRGLGFLEEGGGWKEAAPLLAERRAALGAQDADGRVELARLALRADLRAEADGLLREALRLDNFHAAALELIRPFTDRYRQQVRMRLPVRGRWKASEDPTRHHARKSFAVYALDLSKVDAEGRTHRGRGRALEEHFSYGAPFYAAAAGVVVEVRDGFPDNEIGQIGDRAEKHNGISIDHGNGEFTWYIHARNGSIQVKQGDRVEQGQLLGEVGNSGGSALPHLHFTLVHERLSVPWSCDDYLLVAEDGTPLPVSRACPREGWTLETREP